MSQTKYTRAEIVSFIKDLDTRAQKLSDAKIDSVINRGYAELMTTSKQLFSNEEVVALDEYYAAGEKKVSLDINEDVTEIYDIYFTIEDEDNSICQEVVQGIGIYRNNNAIYRDNRYVGRFHFDLSEVNEVFDNVISKYYYTPKATDADVFMSTQVYLAFQDAIWAALNYFLKDVDGESQKRASMARTSKSATQEPEDVPERSRSIFGMM